MAHGHAHDDHHHPHEDKRLSPSSATIGFVVVALIGVSIGYFVGAPLNTRTVDNLSRSTPPLTGQHFAHAIPIGDSPTWGSDSAPVTVVIFSDFECTFCATEAHTGGNLEDAKRAFGQEKLRIVYKHLPLSMHVNAPLAHRAAYAASRQGLFWEYYEALFNALKANKDTGKAFSRAALIDYARAKNLNIPQFERDMESPAAAQAIASDRALATALSIDGTPSFLVNGRLVDKRGLGSAIQSELNLFKQFTPGKSFSLADHFYAERLSQNLPPNFTLLSSSSTDAFAAAQQPSQGAAVAVPIPTAPTDGRGAAAGGKLDFSKLPIKGNPNAKVTILEFSDFECPFCSKVGPTLQQLLTTYPNDVRVAFVQLPLPFHKNAPLAGQASLAAHAQGKFWPYHDLLFANQRALTRPDLERYAEQLGLDMGQFNAALDANTFQAEVEAQSAFAGSVGVNGTPGFLINGASLSGAQPFDSFKSIIDAELTRADSVAKAKGLSGQALYDELFSTASKPAPRAAEPSGPVAVDIAGAPLKGNPNAPITIIEFSDFECPFCSKVGPTIAQLLLDYPNQIKVVFKQLPLSFHNHAHLAAQASLAAHAQGKFWPFHDLLFANQRALTRPDLERYAEQLGLDMGQFNADLDSGKFKAQVDKELAEAQKNGINGTPNFAINGKRITGAVPIEQFKAVIDAELKR